MTDFKTLIHTLCDNAVDFIIIGGMASTVHGSARLTSDLDIIYSRSEKNIQKIISALKEYHPYLRGAPKGLPFKFEAETLQNGVNFTLITDIGDLDILGEVPGGDYKKIKKSVIEIEIFQRKCKCVSLDKLIELKRAAGRPKDLETIAELEIIREENTP